MTQGPAISPKGCPGPNSIGMSGCGDEKFGGFLEFELSLAMVQRRVHKRAEQRMRLEWLRFKFGMELAAQVPGVILNLADLDVYFVRSFSRQPETARGEYLLEVAVEFVAMPVTFADFRLPVGLAREAAFRQMA